MPKLYTVVICEVNEAGKAPDVKYVNFSQISALIPKVNTNSIIEYLMQTHKYNRVNTIITIKDVHVFETKEEADQFGFTGL